MNNYADYTAYVTIADQTLTLEEWAEVTGVRPETVGARLADGKDLYEAVMAPARYCSYTGERKEYVPKENSGHTVVLSSSDSSREFMRAVRTIKSQKLLSKLSSCPDPFNIL